MLQLSPGDLLVQVEDPFVRHQVDPATTRRAWVADGAVVVDGTRGRPTEQPLGPVFTCLGPADTLGPLMRAVADEVPAPWRLTVDLAAYAVVPHAWRHVRQHRWHWMLTRQAPPAPARAVEELHDAAEIDALLDRAAPDSFARPGVPGIETWLGSRDADGTLLGAGAVLRMVDGTGHLRSVSVLPETRGRGIGTAVSAGLTAVALGGASGVATLGSYTDNLPALAIYEGLGYRVAHTFASGPVAAWQPSTAR